jgi:hypothetical protein
MKKTIEVDLASGTWPRTAAVPAEFVGASGTRDINLASALLMLGTLTTPDLLSPASPARFWAWLRYIFAPAGTPDLRITMDFAALDPHQKGILSDDLGVAISTQWLFDRFGGFADIVDGRRFMLQFAHLLPPRTKPTKAKVGPSKAPDFVIQDLRGRWHVLECKGTQSGRTHRNNFLKNALAQKRVIQITGALRGERLATGLSISNEQSKQPTELRIVDPDGDPIIQLGVHEQESIEKAAHRIAIARALGTVGLGEMALELSLPPELTAETVEFLRPNEAFRFRSSPGARRERAQEQIRDRRLDEFTFRGVKYEGRALRLNDFSFDDRTKVKEIRVRQGVNRELIDEIAGSGVSLLPENLNQRLDAYTANARVKVVTRGTRTTLTYGDVLFATLDLK